MNNIQKLLDAILLPMQDVEDALQQCLTDRTLETATGINLDVIGRLVGELRQGQSDDDYRISIQARVASNRSSGTMEDLIRVAKIIINDTTASIVARNHGGLGGAEVQLTINDLAITDALAEQLIRALADTESAGVRTLLEYGDTDPDTAWLVFDSGSFDSTDSDFTAALST